MTTQILVGDCRELMAGMADKSVHMCATSPPYWGLRDYGIEPSVWGGDDGCEHEWGDTIRRRHEVCGNVGVAAEWQRPSREAQTGGDSGQFCQSCSAWRGCLGLEPTSEMFVEHIVEVFRCVKRVLRDDGTLWLNLGDKSIKKQILALPWRCALALQQPDLRCRGCDAVAHADRWGRFPNGRLICPACEKSKGTAIDEPGWYLRSAMPWVKRNPMPESCTDRPASALEYVFLLSKRPRYFWDMDAVRVKLAGPLHAPGNKKLDDSRNDGDRLAEVWGNDAGRAFRNTELYYESLKPPHGMIHVGDEPVGLDVCPEAFPGAYCTGCQRYYGRGVRHLPKHTDRQGKKHPICPCGQWSKWLSHFATFPRKLALPMIKAGTSQKGCCPECGAPWRRVVEKDRRPTRPGLNNVSDETGMANRDEQRHVTESRTVGWEPGCECLKAEAECNKLATYHVHGPAPCMVLDPFSGAGTVGVVAKQLGRSFIGCEINPDYAEMARKRIANPEPEPEVVDVDGQMELFPSQCMARKDTR